MKRICLVLVLLSSAVNLKAQNGFNMDSMLNHLEGYGYASIEREKATFQFYENLIGCEIPPFNAKSFEGKIINSDSLLGKVVVINFWFIDCKPCMEELPILNELAASYEGNSNIEFLGMSIDDSAYIAEAFINKHKLDFRIIPNTRSIANEYCVFGYPKTYIIDKKGKLRKVYPMGLAYYVFDEVLMEMKEIIDECLE